MLPSAFQPGLPLTDAPGGSEKVWSVEVAPFAMISIVVPLAIGSPTTLSLDPSSLPRATMLRSEASTPGDGSFTTKDLPSTS